MLNIRALFSRGYKLVQTGIIDFELVKDDKIIVNFEIESRTQPLETVYVFLLKELEYTILEKLKKMMNIILMSYLRKKLIILKQYFIKSYLILEIG